MIFLNPARIRIFKRVAKMNCRLRLHKVKRHEHGKEYEENNETTTDGDDSGDRVATNLSVEAPITLEKRNAAVSRLFHSLPTT